MRGANIFDHGVITVCVMPCRSPRWHFANLMHVVMTRRAFYYGYIKKCTVRYVTSPYNLQCALSTWVNLWDNNWHANRACQQHSHNAVFDWNFRNRSVWTIIVLLFTDFAREFKYSEHWDLGYLLVYPILGKSTYHTPLKPMHMRSVLLSVLQFRVNDPQDDWATETNIQLYVL